MSMSLSLIYRCFYYNLKLFVFDCQGTHYFWNGKINVAAALLSVNPTVVVDGIGCAAFATAVECVEVEVLGVGGWVGV